MKCTRTEFEDYTEEAYAPEDPPGSNGKGNGHAKQDTDVGEGPWPVMPVAAYHGLAGEVVAVIAPHTEAHPGHALLGRSSERDSGRAGRGL